jgi:hypothetical protein
LAKKRQAIWSKAHAFTNKRKKFKNTHTYFFKQIQGHVVNGTSPFAKNDKDIQKTKNVSNKLKYETIQKRQ